MDVNVTRAIDQAVDKIYDRLTIRLTGHPLTGSNLFITYNYGALPETYKEALDVYGGTLNKQQLDALVDLTRDYLQKHRHATKAATKQAIQAIYQDVNSGVIKTEHIQNHIDSMLQNIFATASNGVETLVTNELEKVKSWGLKESIEHVNDRAGVVDPVIVFIPVKDQYLCDECETLHLMHDKVVPKAWYYSEVQSGYFHRGDDVPSWNLLHPHCRCSPSTVLPGFGFDGNGHVVWIGDSFSEIDFQRSEEYALGVEVRRSFGK
jgi:hypothetical protein